MTIRELQSFLHPHRQLLVAFSGGLDSTVLLHQLVTLRDTLQPELNIRAMHIHHGLSPKADSWVDHCQALCAKWRVPFAAAYVQLPSGGQGIEGEARAARYQALSGSLLADEVLLTAQHLDDQCETFLLALKRGSGPAGLASMPAILPFSDTLLLRPLLTTSRAQLEEWACAHRLSWIEDESNQDDKYDRNFLRLRIVPLLQRRWPHFSRSVARSADLCGEQEQLLDELLAEQLGQLMSEQGALRIDPMLTMSDARRFALLRRWLAHHRAAMPSRASLQRLWQEVALSREDANPRLRLGEHEIRRFQGELYWVPLLNIDREKSYLWPAPYRPLHLPRAGTFSLSDKGMAVRAPAEGEIVSLRFKAPGLLHIIGRDKGRTLKKIWQELRIPPWERDATPLLFYGEQLIAAPGIFVTREGQATENSCWHIDWQKGVEQ
ncbi:tRNA lysidine(34) synthetase TilS [Cedecea neteri]|uniref:tRNA lysidine(34) synthetase TilS n=1 Tax=Cedecea neteri TaxID=158822 RepID=UPI002AA81CA2|nr:tRNA lysidine(34) synthetase TilS [Cedecea neteri]WPU22248.1 tRNA lysidine(34) synthetase TilS [Cedecea neteri]